MARQAGTDRIGGARKHDRDDVGFLQEGMPRIARNAAVSLLNKACF